VLVDFYQLTSSPLEQVLTQICEKILSGGERLLVVAGDALLEQIDSQLWDYTRDAFLPHGRAESCSPEAQPILLSSVVEPVNNAGNIALADGEWRDEALQFARTFYFFGSAQREAARANWRTLKTRPEVELRYWKQDGAGKWVQGP